MKLRTIFGGLLTMLVLGGTAAQQEAQYTQFMDFKLVYNPGYAGAEPTSEFHLFARQQWAGLDGAPNSQVLTFNTPFSAAGTGLGVRLGRVNIGLENHYVGEVSYAYRIQLRRGARLGIGLSASMEQYSIDFQNATPIQGDGIDPSVPLGQENKVLPNFGAGIYFDSPGFYLGFSAPRLLENNIDFADDETIISRQVRHLYGMTGLTVKISDGFNLRPQALVKLVKGAPFDADFNLTGDIGTSLQLGASYRMGGSQDSGFGESVSVLASFFVSDHLQLGFAYDIGMSELRSQHNGSFGARIRYLVGGRPKVVEVIDPRG